MPLHSPSSGRSKSRQSLVDNTFWCIWAHWETGFPHGSFTGSSMENGFSRWNKTLVYPSVVELIRAFQFANLDHYDPQPVKCNSEWVSKLKIHFTAYFLKINLCFKRPLRFAIKSLEVPVEVYIDKGGYGLVGVYSNLWGLYPPSGG